MNCSIRTVEHRMHHRHLLKRSKTVAWQTTAQGGMGGNGSLSNRHLPPRSSASTTPMRHHHQSTCREQYHRGWLGNDMHDTVNRCDITRSCVLEHDVRGLIRITSEADVQSKILRKHRRRPHAARCDLLSFGLRWMYRIRYRPACGRGSCSLFLVRCDRVIISRM